MGLFPVFLIKLILLSLFRLLNLDSYVYCLTISFSLKRPRNLISIRFLETLNRIGAGLGSIKGHG